jgi:hypothetical protein
MAISLVQSKVGQWSSPSVSFTSNTTAGNCIVIMLTDEGGITATSAAKIGGSTDNFAKLEEKSIAPVSPSLYSAIWADTNCAGGQTALTWTDTGTANLSTYWIGEFSGVAATSAFDTGNTASGSTTPWSCAFTSTSANELWLGALAVGTGSSSGSAGHGWTFVTQTNGGGATNVFGWQVVSSIATATFSGTGGSTLGWSACAAGVKAGSTFLAAPNDPISQAVMRSAVW